MTLEVDGVNKLQGIVVCPGRRLLPSIRSKA